ncbi:MAG TPA: glutathione S-transferase family protein [Candidatus Cybelea sp.]|nr:glutathione S-transferase family protein [Candidatus Cybelea sp.]
MSADRIKIYGVPISRAIRNIWMALELDAPYDNVAIGWSDNSIYGDAYKRINPNARVPSLQSGDLVMWESLAINLYLARKFGGPLAPKTAEEEALAWQWSFWAAAELEQPLIRWAFNTFINEPAKRDAKAAAAAWAEVEPRLTVLDGCLAKSPYLAANRFTVADLNVAAVLLRSRQHLDLAGKSNLKRWLGAVFDRPKARQAVQIREDAARALS